MPEENDDKVDATETDEQPEALDETLPTELPDDPIELKKIAETAISRLTAAQENQAQLLSDKERLEDNLEEQRTKANFWSVKAQELETQVKSKPVAKEKPEAKGDGFDDDTELAIAVTEGMKLSDIDKRAAAIATRIVMQTTENLSRQGAIAKTLTTTYPDLRDTNSALAKGTIAEMARIDEENPGMGDAAKFELATLRSAGRLGIAPKTQSNGDGKGNGKSTEETERARRRAAQGGPAGKPAPSKGAIVITDADRAEARRMNGGQDVPDAVLKNAKKFEMERQRARDARA